MDWKGIHVNNVTYKRSWEESKHYKLMHIYSSGVNTFRIYNKVSSVGIWGVNNLWYISANGKKVAGLHVKAYKKTRFRSEIGCKFYYKTNNLSRGYRVKTCIPLLWAILHYSEFNE